MREISAWKILDSKNVEVQIKEIKFTLNFLRTFQTPLSLLSMKRAFAVVDAVDVSGDDCGVKDVVDLTEGLLLQFSYFFLNFLLCR